MKTIMVPITAEHRILWEWPKRSSSYRELRIQRTLRKPAARQALRIISFGRSTVTIASSNISFGFVNIRWDFVLEIDRNELITIRSLARKSRKSRHKVNEILSRIFLKWGNMGFISWIRAMLTLRFWWLPYMQGWSWRNNWIKGLVRWRYFIRISYHVTISIVKSVVSYFN